MPTRATPDAAGWGLDSIEDIVAAIRAGEMVVVLDDEDRENEGDLIMAAEKVRAEDVNFMARYGRGLICLTLTRQRCEQLRLPLMVSNTDVRKTTNFTISIEAAEGVTTGISAHDRARTILAAVARDARPEDLRQPGHIFPLMAQPGGVLTRAGHTEAGCDLARLAGVEPAAVIVEILNDDGAMARRDDLVKFARRHKLKIGTIADLIAHRLRTEDSVEKIAERAVDTEFGVFRMVCFEDHVNHTVHLALVRGALDAKTPTLVRVHRQDTLGDVLGLRDPSVHWPLRDVLRLIAARDHGVVVVLRPEESARELMKAVQGLGPSPADSGSRHAGAMDLRTFGIGAQILRALGVRRMRVLSAPKNMHALSGFGLEVVEYVSAEDLARDESHG
jgi:3,4-dihydroxy 2-butanone 4-phosphate synthase/GTP cyclohydrolase II